MVQTSFVFPTQIYKNIVNITLYYSPLFFRISVRKKINSRVKLVVYILVNAHKSLLQLLTPVQLRLQRFLSTSEGQNKSFIKREYIFEVWNLF